MDATNDLPGVDASCVMGTGATMTRTIGTDGGTLTFEAVTLTFPPGALTANTAITVTQTLTCTGTTPTPLTPIYQFTPAGLRFAQPVNVTMNYPGPAQSAQLMWTTSFGDFVPIAVSAGGNSVSGTVTHFSDGYVSEPGWVNQNGVLQFLADPEAIDPGESSTLYIAALPGGTTFTCSIDQQVGSVPLHSYLSGHHPPVDLQGGEAVVAPTMTTTYTLTCRGPVTITASTDVTVNATPTLSLTATPNMLVPPGMTITAEWHGVAGVSDCQLTLPSGGAPMTVARSGRQGFPAMVSGDFWLHCIGPQGEFLDRRAYVDICANLGASCDLDPGPSCRTAANPQAQPVCVLNPAGTEATCCLPYNAECMSAPACCGNLDCPNGHCCKAGGGSCDPMGPDVCCSGHCDLSGLCCVGDGNPCADASDLCCTSGAVCMPGAGGTYTCVLPDAGTPDASTPDAGTPDAGTPDAGCAPASADCTSTGCCTGLTCNPSTHICGTSTGMPDAGPPDTGPPDTGRPDTGPPDTGPPDTGTCGGIGFYCDSSRPCCATGAGGGTLRCAAANCCVTPGGACTTSSDCCGATTPCILGQCGCRASGQTCGGPSDCCGTTAGGSQGCSGTPAVCCTGHEQHCDPTATPSQCCAGLACVYRTLLAAPDHTCCADYHQPCTTNLDCCYYAASIAIYGNSCNGGQCCIPRGSPCRGVPGYVLPSGCCPGLSCDMTSNTCM